MLLINVREYRKGLSKMDNLEKLTTGYTRRRKPNKNTTQQVLDNNTHKQIQTT
jgi:hypothetical protein